MTEDNVTKFPGSKPAEPDEHVIKILELALDAAKIGEINFVGVVAMPTNGDQPIIASAGKADPYRVIGALMKGAFTNFGAGM